VSGADPVAALLVQADALEAQARALRTLAEAMKTAAPATSSRRYYTAKDNPAGERTFKRACASRKLKVFKLGREDAVLAVDLEAWIEAQPARGRRRAEPPAAASDQEAADLVELASAGARFTANDQRRSTARGAR
jgi:hypothetical protein